MPLAKFRIIKPYVGGGFGGKAEAMALDFCSAYLSRATGRPVKMTYTRPEMFEHHRGRHKQYMDLKIGVTKDGKITAVDFRNVLDGGAYTSFGVITAYYAGFMIPTLYHIPNYRYHGRRMYTNKPPCGAMRGHGVPQPRFAFESLLDMLAEEIGMDPIDIRMVNAMDPNTRTVNDLDVLSCEFKATLETVRERSGWDAKHGKLPFGRGVGDRQWRLRVGCRLPHLPQLLPALERDHSCPRGRRGGDPDDRARRRSARDRRPSCCRWRPRRSVSPTAT